MSGKDKTCEASDCISWHR